MKTMPMIQPMTETMKKGRNAPLMSGKPLANTAEAKGPSRPLAIGKARVAMPMTMPFLVGNHWPTRMPRAKVAYRTETTLMMA